MMKLGQLLNCINEFAPWRYAEEWDNVGLMLGSRSQEVNKVLLCLDVNSEVVAEAVKQGVNLIISHHPFIFSKLKLLDFDTIQGSLIEKLIKKDIGVISAHTNLDVADGGVNDALAAAIGLSNTKQLKSYVPTGYEVDMGLGKVGELKPETSFVDFIASLKKNLNLQSLRIIGPQPKLVSKVAVFCGSYDNDFAAVKAQGTDVLVTGDVKYHNAFEAREMGLCIVDVGHFASEHIVLDKLKAALDEKLDGIEVICSKVEKDPFFFA